MTKEQARAVFRMARQAYRIKRKGADVLGGIFDLDITLPEQYAALETLSTEFCARFPDTPFLLPKR